MEDKAQINLIGMYLLTTLVILITMPIYTYLNWTDNLSKLITALVYVSCAGGLGGTIYSIRGFYKAHAGDNFELKWLWWYIFRPPISIVIGAIAYFLIVGGLLSVGNISEANYSKSVMFYCAISFLAGFTFSRFTDKLEDLSDTLFSKKEEDKK